MPELCKTGIGRHLALHRTNHWQVKRIALVAPGFKYEFRI